jgi:hypothetical protein
MTLPKTPALIRLMLDYITNTTDSERSFLPFKNDGSDEVVLLVNNLGGLSEMELAAIAGETLSALKERGIKVVRVGAGRYMVRTCLVSSPLCSVSGADVKLCLRYDVDLDQPSRIFLDPPASPSRGRRGLII